jgi:hypothetical protein
VPRRTKLAFIAVMLVTVLCCALISLISLWREDVALGRKLDKVECAYNALQDKYINLKSDTRKLQNEPEYQKEILKNEFGYVGKNDVPVVVVDPDAKGKTQ